MSKAPFPDRPYRLNYRIKGVDQRSRCYMTPRVITLAWRKMRESLALEDLLTMEGEVAYRALKTDGYRVISKWTTYGWSPPLGVGLRRRGDVRILISTGKEEES